MRLKWTSLNVHQLDKVFQCFKLANVLDAVYDSRLCRVEDIAKSQLVKECKDSGLKHSGLKHQLIERLIHKYGPDHMVIMWRTQVFVKTS